MLRSNKLHALLENGQNCIKSLSLSAQHLGSPIVIKSHSEFNQKVINGDNPVIVNFHADWCDPCRELTPKIISLIEPLDDVDLAIVNIDANEDLVYTFEVKAVPAILAFRKGAVVDKFIGLVDEEKLKKIIGNLTRKEET